MIMPSFTLLLLMPLASLALDPPLSRGLGSSTFVADLLKEAIEKVGAATPLLDEDEYFCNALLYGEPSQEVYGYMDCASEAGLPQTEVLSCLQCLLSSGPVFEEGDNPVDFCTDFFNYACGDHNCPCAPCEIHVARYLHCIGTGVGCIFCPFES